MHIHIHLDRFPRKGFPRNETINSEALMAEYADSLEQMVQGAMQLARELMLECQHLEAAGISALERQISFGKGPAASFAQPKLAKGFPVKKSHVN